MKNYPIWHPFTQMKTSMPIMKVKSANGLYLKLENGKKLMDLISSWWVTLHGHGNKVIAKAIYDQALILEQVIFANFQHDPAIRLAEKLKKNLPDKLNHFFFSDNGSTAVEVALKMAYQHWKNQGENRNLIIAFEGAYHGDTLGAMSVSSKSIFTDIFKKLLFPVKRVPFPFTFENDDKIEQKEKESLECLKKLISSNKKNIVAIIIEPLLQGAGGMRMCRKQFLNQLQMLANDSNILLIYDEVLTGFGRTGKMFASTKTDTSPDIICLSKGLTGGFLPMGLTICTDRVYDSFYSEDLMKTFFHGHSYTANPLACAAAITSLDLLEKNKKYENIENWHKKYIKYLKDTHKINNIRICGTIAAMDIISEKKGYLSTIGRKLQKLCLEDNIYLRPLGNVLYLLPPYCITEKELAYSYQVIAKSLKKLLF